MNTIRITIEYRETEGLKRWYVVDSNVEGLFLWGNSLERLGETIPHMINVLRRENKLDIPELKE